MDHTYVRMLVHPGLEAQMLTLLVYFHPGTRFNCHKVILVSCSDYFLSMFTSGMRECNQKEIELKGITAKGLEKVIEVVYTSTTTLEGKIRNGKWTLKIDIALHFLMFTFSIFSKLVLVALMVF